MLFHVFVAVVQTLEKAVDTVVFTLFTALEIPVLILDHAVSMEDFRFVMVLDTAVFIPSHVVVTVVLIPFTVLESVVFIEFQTFVSVV